MKRLIHYSHFLQILFFTIVSALVLSSCHNHSSGGNNETTPSAGESDSYPFIPGLILNMQFCPGGTEVPMETDNSGSSTVNAFWIGETEVTYALWSTVYNWATAGIGSGTGEGEYSFQNEGYPGAGIGNSIEHPATNINWRDAMVFCNSITEYCNSKCGTDFNPVYTTSASFITPIRDSRDGNATVCDSPFCNPNADGFRLPESAEWECAARYIDGFNWTFGDHVSGDESGPCYLSSGDTGLGGLSLSTVFGDYAVYSENSSLYTSPVFSKGSNYCNNLGCYDMGGNAWEWCFTLYETARIKRGGSALYDARFLRCGHVAASFPDISDYDFGLRLCRNAE